MAQASPLPYSGPHIGCLGGVQIFCFIHTRKNPPISCLFIRLVEHCNSFVTRQYFGAQPVAFCLCFQQKQVLFKMLHTINDSVTPVEKKRKEKGAISRCSRLSYSQIGQFIEHESPQSMFNVAFFFFFTKAIQLFEMEQYVSKNLL